MKNYLLLLISIFLFCTTTSCHKEKGDSTMDLLVGHTWDNPEFIDMSPAYAQLIFLSFETTVHFYSDRTMQFGNNNRIPWRLINSEKTIQINEFRQWDIILLDKSTLQIKEYYLKGTERKFSCEVRFKNN